MTSVLVKQMIQTQPSRCGDGKPETPKSVCVDLGLEYGFLNKKPCFEMQSIPVTAFNLSIFLITYSFITWTEGEAEHACFPDSLQGAVENKSYFTHTTCIKGLEILCVYVHVGEQITWKLNSDNILDLFIGESYCLCELKSRFLHLWEACTVCISHQRHSYFGRHEMTKHF